MTGRRIGRVVVIGRGEDYPLRNGKRRPQWWCLCDCGNMTLVVGQNLRNSARRTGPVEYSCGCAKRESMSKVGRSNWQGDDITYNTAHKRVRWARGRARDHDCVDCGGSAAEWSYQFTDPDDQMEMVSRRGRLVPARYSTDPAHYAPRCHSCHVRFDKGRSDG